MHPCASLLSNLGSRLAIALRARGDDLQGDSENLKDTSSVTRQILQQSPFSTAC
jgi:hypothetical protein